MSRYAKRRLALNKVSVAGFVLLLVNVPVFIGSDVVGEVEFRLPTTITDGEVVSVDSFGPWHHRAMVRYNVKGQTFTESSWATRREVEVGQRVRVQYQNGFVDHAKIAGQRKFAIALWQAGILPCVSLLLWMVGFVVGRRRVRLGQFGLLATAQPDGNGFTFDIEQPNPEAGYRDKATVIRRIHLPKPRDLPKQQLSEEQPVLYAPAEPERGILLRGLGIEVGPDQTLTGKRRGSMAKGLFVLVPYVILALLLMEYYLSNS